MWHIGLQGVPGGKGHRATSSGQAQLQPMPEKAPGLSVHVQDSGGRNSAGLFSEVFTPAMRGVQELRVFLEAEDSLATSFEWAQLQPMHGTILEGVARLPRQLFGKKLVG